MDLAPAGEVFGALAYPLVRVEIHKRLVAKHTGQHGQGRQPGHMVAQPVATHDDTIQTKITHALSMTR